MTLPFKIKFKNGKPTFFLEKVHKSLVDNKLIKDIHYSGDHKPKIHTIREDKSNRWKAGRDIHFVINNRTKYRFQFAPVVKCKSVQKINIFHRKVESIELETWIEVDGELLLYDDIKKLALNDGFDLLIDFLDYFSEDFTGKIIHWTDFKY